MSVFVERMPSPVGTLLLVWEEEALRALDFGEERLDRWLGAGAVLAGRAPASIRDPLAAYFEGDLAAIDTIQVKTPGTPFQQKVWAALREIPAGRTCSYGELATRIGRPGAGRAVGLANGSNPAGIVVPCHRVIGANGSLVGYGGGLDRKRWLLAHERASAAEGHFPFPLF